MKRKSILPALVVLSFLPLNCRDEAQAVNATVQFSATLLGACVLVATNGTLAPSADYTTLDSTLTGGLAGLVTATATSGTFKFSLVAPSSFTSAPTGGNTNLTFATTYSGTGATTIGSTSGATQTSLNFGITALSVNLSATKSTGVFPAGSYQADVTAQCQ